MFLTSLTPLSVVKILWTAETTCLFSSFFPCLSHLLVISAPIKKIQPLFLQRMGFVLNLEQLLVTTDGLGLGDGMGEGVGDGVGEGVGEGVGDGPMDGS